MKPLAAFLILFLYWNTSLAQKSLPAAFQQQLADADMVFFMPLEQSFKRTRVMRKGPFAYQHAIRSKKGRMEIRYAIRLFDSDDPRADIPHVRMLSLASHLASNEEEEHIAIHQIKADELADIYHADWGAYAIFRPKYHFSDRRFCKMISLYRDNKAQAFVFILFDKANEESDQQVYTLRFKGEALGELE